MSNTECIYFKDLPRIEHFTTRRRRSPCVRRVGVQSGLRPNAGGTRPFKGWPFVGERAAGAAYEESVVDKFKSNLLLMIFWLHIINYNS